MRGKAFRQLRGIAFHQLPVAPPQLASGSVRLVGGGAKRAAVSLELANLKLAPLPPQMDQLMSGLTSTIEHKGKLVAAHIAMRRRFWTVFGAMHGFPLIAEAANRLLSMHGFLFLPLDSTRYYTVQAYRMFGFPLL